MEEEFRRHIVGYPQSVMYLRIMEVLTAILRRQAEILERLDKIEGRLEKISRKLDSLFKDST